MSSHVLVWTLASVADLDGYAQANGLEDRPLDEIRAALGSDAERPVHRAVLCLGGLLARHDGDGWKIASASVDSLDHKGEDRLVSDFADAVAAFSPRLVCFDGAGYDVCVLRYRAMIHHVRAHFLFRPNESSDHTVDLARQFSPDKPGRQHLGEVCRTNGIPPIRDPEEPLDVEACLQDGRIDDVVRACEQELVDMYRLWLVAERGRGTLSEAEYRSSEHDIARHLSMIEAMRACDRAVA